MFAELYLLTSDWLRARVITRVLYPFMVIRGCRRKGQDERESQLRSFFIEPRIKKLRQSGRLLVSIGAVSLGSLLLIALIVDFGNPGCIEGCFLGLISLALLLGVILLPCGLAILAGTAAIKTYLPTSPSPEKVADWLLESIHRLRQHSLGRLGLTEDQVSDIDIDNDNDNDNDNGQSAKHIPPIISAILWETDGVDLADLLWRFEGEHEYYGIYRVVFSHFAEEHLGVYACDFNFIKDVTLNDKSWELSYQDIVTFETIEKNSSYSLPTGQKLNLEQSFCITVPSGGSISLGRSTPTLRTQLDENSEPATATDASIEALRANIRDRKLALTKRDDGSSRSLPPRHL